jgi:hypothetical protein
MPPLFAKAAFFVALVSLVTNVGFVFPRLPRGIMRFSGQLKFAPAANN